MIEALKVRFDIVPYTRGRVLEVGCDGVRSFPHFTTIDEGPGEDWRPDIITPLDDLSIFASQSFDSVFASHILNNVEDGTPYLKEWWRVLKQNGYLLLHFPNNGKQKDIIEMMKAFGSWDLCHSEPKDDTFLQVFKKTGHSQTYSYAEQKKGKTCGIFRHGGFGDMILVSPILKSLKEQGYRNIVYTSPSAMEVVKEDPNVDEFVIQDKDQIPNVGLPGFWDHLKNKHDKFINFSETVEAAFLALGDRMPFTWPQEALNRYMNHNYEEFSHLVAGVKMSHRMKFYETEKEGRQADAKRKKIGGKLVMWVLAGSSVHKIYPWMDEVIARFMLETDDVKFVFVGDGTCKILEDPWRKEPRVIRLSGEYSIRDTMALAKRCDVVVGPETGVMSAVGHEPVGKVIALSHSSVENLTKHWENTVSMTPENCKCYPCHRMIYGFDQCNRDDKTGVAKCAANISHERMISAIKEQLGK